MQMKYLFYHCNYLTSLDLSKFYKYNIDEIRYIFANCSNIRYLDISSFREVGVLDNLLSDISDNVTIIIQEKFMSAIKNMSRPSWKIILK